MAAIQAGLGGLRKTSVAGGPAPGPSKPAGAAAASPARTFAAPSAAAKSPVTSPSSSGSTQPAAAAASPARTFGAPRAAVVTTPAATAAKPAAAAAAAKPAVAAKPAAAPAPAAAKPEDSGWQELMTPEGVPYYHNKLTNVTTWSVLEEREKQRAATSTSKHGQQRPASQSLTDFSLCCAYSLLICQGQARRVEDRRRPGARG